MFLVLSYSDFKSRSNSNQPYTSMVRGLLKEDDMYQNSDLLHASARLMQSRHVPRHESQTFAMAVPACTTLHLYTTTTHLTGQVSPTSISGDALPGPELDEPIDHALQLTMLLHPHDRRSTKQQALAQLELHNAAE
jgi:hypothetical protein